MSAGRVVELLQNVQSFSFMREDYAQFKFIPSSMFSYFYKHLPELKLLFTQKLGLFGVSLFDIFLQTDFRTFLKSLSFSSS